MRNALPLLLVATLAAAPFAFASDLPVSTPKPHCETAADWKVHAYGPTGDPFGPFLTQDGSAGDCDGDGSLEAEDLLTGDRHFEYGFGGAVLLADARLADLCWRDLDDHPAYPNVTVVDDALGASVEFVVWAYDRHPFLGDCETFFELYQEIACTGSCQVPFPPGPDGAYYVQVKGTSGRVVTN